MSHDRRSAITPCETESGILSGADIVQHSVSAARVKAGEAAAERLPWGATGRRATPARKYGRNKAKAGSEGEFRPGWYA